MTRDEWETIALLIENCWRGEFDETRSAAYFTMLGRFQHGEVMAALLRITEDGKPFAPAVPEIVAAIRAVQEPALPAWTEAWSEIERALGKNNEAEAVAFLNERCHPVVGAFLRAEGFEKLRYEPFYDPDYGSLRLRELHQRWKEFAERAVERERNGLAIESGQRTGLGLGKMRALPGSTPVGQ